MSSEAGEQCGSETRFEDRGEKQHAEGTRQEQGGDPPHLSHPRIAPPWPPWSTS